MEREGENVFTQLSKQKKNMDRISIYEAISSSIYEQSKSQHYSCVKIRCVKTVINAVATEASCCVVLIGGLIDETQMDSINTKHSHDLSEHKKKRCLNFQKFPHTLSSFISNESNFQFNQRIHKFQFKTGN